MASTEDNFLTDEVLSRRESNLLWSTFDKRDIFTNARARRHLTEGFDRRHYMLQLSRLFLCQNYSQSRKPPLSSSEATHCAIRRNAYYLNLRGKFRTTWRGYFSTNGSSSLASRRRIEGTRGKRAIYSTDVF